MGSAKVSLRRNLTHFAYAKKWFNDDGSIYDETKASVQVICPEEDKNANYYMGEIKSLQEELDLAKKLPLFYDCVSLNY